MHAGVHMQLDTAFETPSSMRYNNDRLMETCEGSLQSPAGKLSTVICSCSAPGSADSTGLPSVVIGSDLTTM